MSAVTPAYAHAYQSICLARNIPVVPSQKFRLLAKARFPHLPNIRTTTRERGNGFQGWAIYTDEGTRLVFGETLAGWRAVARSLSWKDICHVWPGCHARSTSCFRRCQGHSKNTAEMLAIVEALSFLGPHGLVARDACSGVVFGSKHAASVCSGTIHARTHVQIGLSCQQLLLKVQHKLLFTMQHIYSQAEILGNECADHAVALGIFGLVSNQNLSTRWTRHSFDSAACCATCINLGNIA